MSHTKEKSGGTVTMDYKKNSKNYIFFSNFSMFYRIISKK